MVHRIHNFYKRLFSGTRCDNTDHPAVVVYNKSLRITGTQRQIGLSGEVHDEGSFLSLVPPGINELFSADPVDKISLIIAPIFFVYTAFELPGVEPDKLRDALQLQLPMLLPGCSDNDLLAYMDFNYNDETGSALWMKSGFADSLVDSLLKYDVYLDKIIPRPVSFTKGAADKVFVEDKDHYQNTLIEVSAKKINSWYSICGSDLDNQEFVNDYNAYREGVLKTSESGKTVSLLTLTESVFADATSISKRIYFVPRKYNALLAKIKKNKSFKVIAAFLMIISLLLVTPFAVILFEYKSLNEKIVELEHINADSITLSNSIEDFKKKWSIIDDFPDVNVFDLLTFLNDLVPRDSWLISVTLDNGLLEITGYSPDPDKILQLLSGQDLFAEVAYSQVVRVEKENNEYNYFGIECEIREIDILSYLGNYFQDDYAY